MTAKKATHAPGTSKAGLKAIANAVGARKKRVLREALLELREARAKRDAGKRESDELQKELIGLMASRKLPLTDGGSPIYTIDLPDEGITVDGVLVTQYPRATNSEACLALKDTLTPEQFEAIMPRSPDLKGLDAALKAAVITKEQYDSVVGLAAKPKVFIDLNERAYVERVVAAAS